MSSVRLPRGKAAAAEQARYGSEWYEIDVCSGKCLSEGRLGQGVELGEDLAVLGAEVVCVVEDRGDPALFAQRW